MLEDIADIRRQFALKPVHQVSFNLIRATAQDFREILDVSRDKPNKYQYATERHMKSLNVDANLVQKHAVNLRNSTVESATADMLKDRSINSIVYAFAFIKAAAIEDAVLRSRDSLQQLVNGTHPVCQFALPGDEMGEFGAPANHEFLYKNQRNNWLRLIGCYEPVEYDELHQRGMYVFTHSRYPNNFAREIVSYRNGPDGTEKLIEGKDVLEIGSGNGADLEHYLRNGAKSAQCIDGSAYILKRLIERISSLGPDISKRFHPPRCNEDMMSALEEYELHPVDTICAHSCFHYFDDERAKELFERCAKALRPEGHLTFAVKAPDATLDCAEAGICITDQTYPHKISRKTGFKFDDFVKKRTWFNHDGQFRVFRSLEAWKSILSEQFHIVRATESEVINYETDIQCRQIFYNFIAKPKMKVPASEPEVATSRIPMPLRMIPGMIKNAFKK